MNFNHTLDQIDLTDICRTLHSTEAEYMFFSGAYVHMMEHKQSFRKFNKIEIIPSIFSNHNNIKLEINNKKRARKSINM